MATAPQADQHRLLSVQELDTRAAQARHRRATLPQLEELQRNAALLANLDGEIALAATAVADIRREVTKAEDDVQSVRARHERDTKRLDSGEGSAKDLQALQSEVEVLSKRMGDLEDVELEVMERLEVAEGELAAKTSERESLVENAARLERERDEAFALIESELEDISKERVEASGGLDAGLLALYDKIASQQGGVGAARLAAGACQGCHMNLNAAELAAIEKSAPDDIVRCEECGRILVRGAA